MILEDRLAVHRITRQQALAEIGACVIGGAAYVALAMADVPRRWAIIALAVGIVGYVVLLGRRRTESPADFGLRRDNLLSSVKEVAVVTAVAAVAILVLALALRRSLHHAELWIVAPLYPLFGIAQQLAVQGVLQRRLLRLWPHPAVGVVGAAVGYALLHAAKPRLLVLTLLAGLVWSWLYQRHPNVWTLGVSHGLLGALTFPLVLGTDPLTLL
jgi:membrane protease YdiL (CAAX protease family)